MDALFNMVASLIDGVTSSVNAAWTTLSPPNGVIEHTMSWLIAMDAWLPVSDVLIMIALISTCAAFAFAFKMGTKLVDWVRG